MAREGSPELCFADVGCLWSSVKAAARTTNTRALGLLPEGRGRGPRKEQNKNVSRAEGALATRAVSDEPWAWPWPGLLCLREGVCSPAGAWLQCGSEHLGPVVAFLYRHLDVGLTSVMWAARCPRRAWPSVVRSPGTQVSSVTAVDVRARGTAAWEPEAGPVDRRALARRPVRWESEGRGSCLQLGEHGPGSG